MVKSKLGNLGKFTARSWGHLGWILPASAVLTFMASWAGIFPSTVVEKWYARGIFPIISELAEKVADAVSFSWLDVLIPAVLVSVIMLLRRRQWAGLLNLVAGAYLIFFWSWALNYHRLPLASKLEVDASKTHSDAIQEFAVHAAAEINRLYGEKEKQPYDDNAAREEAVRRVEHVVRIIDGEDWDAAHRIKVSRISNVWFRAAGVDGMFNPAGHEPVISATVLDIERPFVMSHELAHVRGYPDEGDANVIAAFATLMSSKPDFQYSGWLSLWLYLRNRDLDKLLDPGPRSDLRRIFDRARAEQVWWVDDLQRFV